jgi:hypothetical protein
MTTGLTQSFYDFYSAPAVAYRAAYFPIEDTGDGGVWVWAYTAQLGNGLTATLSAEQRRMVSVLNTSAAAAIIPGGSPFATGYGGDQVPDIIGNIRIDQTWGSAQVMAVAHDVNPTYYGATTGTGTPGDTWGWVVGAGLRLNFPMIAQGDYFQGEVNYTHGALRYLNDTNSGNFGASMGNEEVFGVESDCVFGGTTAANETGCNLTTAFSINASYEHYWTPSVHESFVGSYYAVSYNNQANALLCTEAGGGNGGAGIGVFATATSGCNNNWNMYGVGSRLQWDVTKSFYLGVEVLYDHIDSATTFNGLTAGYGLGGANAPAFQESGMDTWAATVRMHKDFLP